MEMENVGGDVGLQSCCDRQSLKNCERNLGFKFQYTLLLFA